MLIILGGLALIVLGLFFILQRKDPKPVYSTNSDTLTKDTLKEEVKKESQVSSIVLEDLIAPSNFPEIVLYFGSQTGTAEKFCGVLEQEAQKIKGIPNTKVTDFEEFKQEIFVKQQLVIIAMSTHYEGDPCDNTKKFYKWMREQRKIKDPELLKGMKFTVFGLGDTSYEQYNFMGKYVNEALEELGAERIYKYGEGNAEGNHTEDDFNQWKADIWPQLIAYYSSKQTANEKEESKQRVFEKPIIVLTNKIVEYPLDVELLGDDAQFAQPDGTQYEMAIKQHQIAKDLPIKSIFQLRQNLDQGSTLEISYDLRNTGQSYKTATNLAVFPENNPEDVQECAQLLGYPLEQMFAFKVNPNSNKKGAIKHPFPTPINVKEALTKFVDLRGPVRKRVLKDLSVFCTEESEKQRLLYLSNAKEEFVEEIEKPMLGMIDILAKFKSLHLPMDAFFQISDRIMPRYYTIASSNLKYPDEVKIAISLEINKFDQHDKMGQVSRYIQDIYSTVKDFSTQRVTNRVFIKESNFNLPATLTETPIIMVGPGTGVVPFIGFMQERQMLIKEQELKLAQAYLFFGCRQSTSDFIYKEEIVQYESQGIVDKAFIALSREQGQDKVYVQDMMRTSKDLLHEILEVKKGFLYICGSTKMGHDVQLLLKEFFGEDGFKALEKEKRLVKELWG